MSFAQKCLSHKDHFSFFALFCGIKGPLIAATRADEATGPSRLSRPFATTPL